MIISKNRLYAQLFTSLFRIRKIHKTYHAIVKGNIGIRKKILNEDLFYFEGNKKIRQKATTKVDLSNIQMDFLFRVKPNNRKNIN